MGPLNFAPFLSLFNIRYFYFSYIIALLHLFIHFAPNCLLTLLCVLDNVLFRLEKVEHDLLELQSFTNLENKADVQHEPDLALKQKVETLSQRNTVLENERLEYLQLKDEIVITTENLTETQKT